MYSLLAILGVIGGTQLGIAKPDYSPVDYYYFKNERYNVNCQVVVDADKRFRLVYRNARIYSRMLQRSMLHYNASHSNLASSVVRGWADAISAR